MIALKIFRAALNPPKSRSFTVPHYSFNWRESLFSLSTFNYLFSFLIKTNLKKEKIKGLARVEMKVAGKTTLTKVLKKFKEWGPAKEKEIKPEKKVLIKTRTAKVNLSSLKKFLGIFWIKKAISINIKMFMPKGRMLKMSRSAPQKKAHM